MLDACVPQAAGCLWLHPPPPTLCCQMLTLAANLQHLASCGMRAREDALAPAHLVRDASLMLASVVCKDGLHWVWDVVESDEDGELHQHQGSSLPRMQACKAVVGCTRTVGGGAGARQALACWLLADGSQRSAASCR